jgi:hypothetical protein
MADAEISTANALDPDIATTAFWKWLIVWILDTTPTTLNFLRAHSKAPL